MPIHIILLCSSLPMFTKSTGALHIQISMETVTQHNRWCHPGLRDAAQLAQKLKPLFIHLTENWYTIKTWLTRLPHAITTKKSGIFALPDTSNSFPAIVYMLIAQVLVNLLFMNAILTFLYVGRMFITTPWIASKCLLITQFTSGPSHFCNF